MDKPANPATDALTRFAWERQPEAESLVRELVTDFLARCPEAAALAERMRVETGTRFGDWVDYIELPSNTPSVEERLAGTGYVERPELAREGSRCWGHPGGEFPLIAVRSAVGNANIDLAIKVESVADFAAANGVFLGVDGEPWWPMRRLLIEARDAVFYAVERHGCRGLDWPVSDDEDDAIVPRILRQNERVRCRMRSYSTDEANFETLERVLDAAIEAIGRDLTCDLFFAAEREYWQRRNRAAQFQKARQDRLGLGWANHDHHTYRSSRRHFTRLVALWEKLGFELRERFYAGAEAGWGAQVCEHPVTGIVTFNDVDLSPDELMTDFAHEPLSERKELGTVGLWCALHGESILEAGMHHLECQFDFEALREQMEKEAGIPVMKPFTDLPYLRQAFTQGERWPVKEERIARLLTAGQITPGQAETFRREGAIGSHLENLERNEGFKGFNQKGVSDIIARTDPRRREG